MIDVPAAYQRRPWSRAEAAAGLGISDRQYRRRLAAARRILPELGDPPHVPIVDAPGPGYCYVLDAEDLSRLPAGLMRIGEAPPAARDGGGAGTARPGRLEGRLRVRHVDEAFSERIEPPRPAPKFKPKRPPKKKDLFPDKVTRDKVTK